MGLGTGCVCGTGEACQLCTEPDPTGDPSEGHFGGRRCLGLSWLGNTRGRLVPWPFLQQLTRCHDVSGQDRDDGAPSLSLLGVHARSTLPQPGFL